MEVHVCTLMRVNGHLCTAVGLSRCNCVRMRREKMYVCTVCVHGRVRVTQIPATVQEEAKTSPCPASNFRLTASFHLQ